MADAMARIYGRAGKAGALAEPTKVAGKENALPPSAAAPKPAAAAPARRPDAAAPSAKPAPAPAPGSKSEELRARLLRLRATMGSNSAAQASGDRT